MFKYRKILFHLLLFIFSLYAFGQPKGYSLKVDDSDLDRFSKAPIQSYSQILDSSTPAVVAVTTQQVVEGSAGSNNPIEDLLRRYYGLPRLGQTRIEERKSSRWHWIGSHCFSARACCHKCSCYYRSENKEN